MTPEEEAENLAVKCDFCHVQAGQECISTLRKDKRLLIKDGNRRFHHYRRETTA